MKTPAQPNKGEVALTRYHALQAVKWLEYCVQLMQQQAQRIKETGLPKMAAAFEKEIPKVQDITEALRAATLENL